jgi:flagellar protein FlaI
MNIPKPLLTMIDTILVMLRTEIKGRPARRATTATEVVALESKTKEIVTREIFRWNPKGDRFRKVHPSYVLERNMEKFNLTEEEIERELKQRKVVLEWMVENKIRHYIEVSKVIREYYRDPERVYRRARMNLK